MANNSTFSKNAHGVNEVALTENAGYCILCSEKAECKCDRCGDFYCSEVCQRKDWHNHRYICFPMPNLVKTVQCSSFKKDQEENGALQNVYTKPVKTAANSSMPPNGSCVILTAFKSSNRCFIRSTNPSIVAEYQKVLNEINNFGKTSSTLTENPKSNSYALALRGDKWCRVEVLHNRKNNKFRICFIDYGDINIKYLKDLRKITPEIQNLKCFIYEVQLKGIPKLSNQPKLLDSLTQYTNKEYKIEFKQPDEEGGNAELYHWGNNTSLNSLILTKCDTLKDNDIEQVSVASFLSNENDIQRCNENSYKVNEPKTSIEKNICKNNGYESLHVASPSTKIINPTATPRQIQISRACLQPPFEIMPINENDRNCKAIIMDISYLGTGFIGCLLDKHIDNLKAITKFLKEYTVNDQSYKPKLNEYCLANYEKEWYRAKVVEIISDDKFLVMYIDFTNEMEVTSKFIRRYPMSLTLPCYTTLCAIDGLPEDLSEELKQFLETNCTAFTSLKIDKVKIIDDIPYIKTNELIKELRDSKLL